MQEIELMGQWVSRIAEDATPGSRTSKVAISLARPWRLFRLEVR
jgi:hypothetical protein